MIETSMCKEAKVVALTAYSNKECADRCKEIGMNKLLHKPAKSLEIVSTIK